MSLEDKILYAFVTGEVSEPFWGRSDLSKYDLGAALLENYYVDFRGGVVSRQGSEFGGPLGADVGKLHRFQGTVSDYLMVFSEYRLRFMQNNSYITEPAKTATSISQGATTTVTINSHGYEDGDLVIAIIDTGMVELNQRQFIVANATTNTFRLRLSAGVGTDSTDYTAANGTETFARVYTVETPYEEADLATLDVEQRYNTVRLTHINYARRVLTFVDSTNWTLEEAVTGSSATPPADLTGTPSTSGSAGTSFAVTSIDPEGVESYISPYLLEEAMVNYSTTAGSYTLNWTPVDGAPLYNVYRGLILPDGADVIRGSDLAYIGTTAGSQFTDNNIIPDYTKTPPIDYDPFAENTIYRIDVDTVGSGYDKSVGMWITGPGSGFLGYPVVDTNGSIAGVTIINGGSGYTSPGVSIEEFTATPAEFSVTVSGPTSTITAVTVVDGGTGYVDATPIYASNGTGFTGYINVTAGVITSVTITNGGSYYSNPVMWTEPPSATAATFTVQTTGTPGDLYPSLFRIFQQRGIYFATKAEPATLWASKPKVLDNYDYGQVVNAGDGYTFTLDSVAVKPIKHALALKNGLLIFNDDGIVQLRAESGKAITALNALAEPQVYTGISDTPPIAVNLDVLFLTENGLSLNTLLYTEYTESFQLQDLSVLASHLLSSDNPIQRLVHHADPYKLIYMPKEDGTMLTLTHVREQEVFGWSRHSTCGLYKDCVEIKESGKTYVYQLVERYLQGAWQTLIERIPRRQDDLPENYWGVDCGLKLALDEPDATLTASGITGVVTLTVSGGTFNFALGDVSDTIYYAGGKLEITGYNSSTSVEGTYLRDATEYITCGESSIPVKAAAGKWSKATPVGSVTGLWHLEGATVSINFDGDAVINQTVENGQVELPHYATKVYVGLPYVCRGSSLPLIIPNRIVEGQDSKIFSVLPRLYRTRGLAIGSSFDDLEEMEDRSDEDWGAGLNLRSDAPTITVDSSYEADAQVYWEQRYPLPATLLGFVAKLDVGEK